MGRSSRTPWRNGGGWLVVAVATWGLALVCVFSALIYQRDSTKPIGEGELFYEDAMVAADMVNEIRTPDTAVRQVRNELEIEAVSLVTAEGQIAASTSESLIDTPLVNPLLNFGLSSGRFAALAGATETEIEIDGVTVWPAGTVLYEALLPLQDGRAVLLHYDVPELLAKRAQPGDIQPHTLQLLTVAGIFGILGTVILVGHQRAKARQLQLSRESTLLRDHADELEGANVLLAQARTRAEGALAIAEEKMRIRSEFVLMINHELRTPLTSVVTGARLLRDGAVDPDEEELVIDQMVAQGERLNEIIDQMLAVARIENRGLAYDLADTPLVEAASAVGADTYTRVDPAGLDVRTDVGTLGLVIGSLSENAAIHGAKTVKVSCSDLPIIEPMVQHGTPPPRVVYFAVSDDGPGIDPDFLPRAFEKFEKNSSNSGTGLGLYMVRLMVDALGGSIGVTTSPLGTTFQIAVPAVAHAREVERV